MRFSMSSVTPARQAERILAAWDSGDRPLLRQELHSSRRLSSHEYSPGMDEERLELLTAITENMLRAPDPLLTGHKDPSIRRCLDLLVHLSRHSPAI